MVSRRHKLQIKIVLDTNAIWNGSESYLLRKEMSDLVNSNRGDAHLEIEWILPEVVLRERQYQMQREAITLLTSIVRLERVIGHSLNIGEDLIRERISIAVKQQIDEHRLVIHPASYTGVDWIRLVEDAINRRPPFEEKSEKGFRDAIICETFLQLVEKSPNQPQRCRIILLTNDALLANAVKSRMSGRNNVQILTRADELKGLINTLISTVPEEYVSRLQAKAHQCFFTGENPTKGFLYDMKVQDAILDQCRSQLTARPEGTSRRSNGDWELNQPRFVKKEGQRVFWVSRFSIAAKAYKDAPQQLSPYEGLANAIPTESPYSFNIPSLQTANPVVNMTMDNPGFQFYGSGLMPQSFGMRTVSLASLVGNEKLVAIGKTIVDVHWSVSVSVKGVFSKLRMDSIEFVETTWENVP